MSDDRDRCLAHRARRQLGVFTLRQALACGLRSDTVYRRVRAGRYQKRFPGVFADAAAPDGRDARCLAALLWVGGEVALAGPTAAELHGLEHGLSTDKLHLVVRSRTFPEVAAGLVVHRARHLDEDQVTLHHGLLRVTTVERTLCDLATLVDDERLRRMVGAAVRQASATPASLAEVASSLGRFRGKRRMIAVLEELSPLEASARSEMESTFLRITTKAGIPPDAPNHRVVDALGNTRFLDAVYLAERQPVELDSRSHHGTLLDWNDDLRRENAVKLAGFRDPVRFSHADLHDRPDDVIRVVRLALEQARQHDCLRDGSGP